VTIVTIGFAAYALRDTIDLRGLHLPVSSVSSAS
jgi:hypothetical protein